MFPLFNDIVVKIDVCCCFIKDTRQFAKSSNCWCVFPGFELLKFNKFYFVFVFPITEKSNLNVYGLLERYRYFCFRLKNITSRLSYTSTTFWFSSIYNICQAFLFACHTYCQNIYFIILYVHIFFQLWILFRKWMWGETAQSKPQMF